MVSVLVDHPASPPNRCGGAAQVNLVRWPKCLGIATLVVMLQIRDKVQTATGRRLPTRWSIIDLGSIHIVNPLGNRARRNVVLEPGDEAPLVHHPGEVAEDVEIILAGVRHPRAVLVGWHHGESGRLLLDGAGAGVKRVSIGRDDCLRLVNIAGINGFLGQAVNATIPRHRRARRTTN